MPNTFELIASSTVGSGGSTNIGFTSIPSTYTDLCLEWSGRLTSTGSEANPWTATGITLNGTASSSQKQLFGTGSAVGSDLNGSPIFVTDTNATSSTFSSGALYLPNYTSSNQKTMIIDVVTENNATASVCIFWAGLFNVTSAVNSISLTGSSYTFAQYTTAYLYGVKNA